MSTPPADDTGAALPPMALLATLQTATTVWEAVEERRAGRDPAAQEPADAARAYLEAAAGQLMRLHMQLLMAKVQAARSSDGDAGDSSERSEGNTPAAHGSIQNDPSEETPPEESSAEASSATRLASSVRRFDLLMKLRRTDRLLHGAHQRLMSLYPAVSEELVEEARHCQGTLSRLRGAPGSASNQEDFDARLGTFLQRLLSFAAWMQREL